MDFFTADWISEMETVDAAFVPKWQMNSIDASLDNLDVNLFSPSSYITDPTPRSTQSTPNYEAFESEIYIPDQQLRNKDLNNMYVEKRWSQQKDYSSPSAKIIAFGDASANRIVKIEADAGSFGEMSFQDPISPNSIQKLYSNLEYGEPVKRSVTRTNLQAQDHVFAERKRREKLSELFASLSTLIPGLKKLDKASILRGTIEHLKQLEERLEALEKEKKKRENEEPVVSVYAKRPRVSSCDDTSSSIKSFDSFLDGSIPEIEVRTCDGNIILRVNIKKRTGILKEILCEVEKLGLCIISSSVMPFGDTTLHMTVIAQMDGDFSMTDESLPVKVRQAILKLLLCEGQEIGLPMK